MPIKMPKKPKLPKGVTFYCIKNFKVNGRRFVRGDVFDWKRLSIAESRVLSMYDHRLIGVDDPNAGTSHKIDDEAKELKQNLKNNRTQVDPETKKPARQRRTKKTSKKSGLQAHKGGWYHVFLNGEQLTESKLRKSHAISLAEQYNAPTTIFA